MHGDGKKKSKRQADQLKKKEQQFNFQPVLISKKNSDYNDSVGTAHDRLFRRGEKKKAEKLAATKKAEELEKNKVDKECTFAPKITTTYSPTRKRKRLFDQVANTGTKSGKREYLKKNPIAKQIPSIFVRPGDDGGGGNGNGGGEGGKER